MSSNSMKMQQKSHKDGESQALGEIIEKLSNDLSIQSDESVSSSAVPVRHPAIQLMESVLSRPETFLQLLPNCTGCAHCQPNATRSTPAKSSNELNPIEQLNKYFKDDHDVYAIDVNCALDCSLKPMGYEPANPKQAILFPMFLIQFQQFAMQSLNGARGCSPIALLEGLHKAVKFVKDLFEDNREYFLRQLSLKYDPRKHLGPSILNPELFDAISNDITVITPNFAWWFALWMNPNVQSHIDVRGNNFLAAFMNKDPASQIVLHTGISHAGIQFPIEAVFWPNRVVGYTSRITPLAYVLKSPVQAQADDPTSIMMAPKVHAEVVNFASKWINSTRPMIKTSIVSGTKGKLVGNLADLCIKYLDGGFQI